MASNDYYNSFNSRPQGNDNAFSPPQPHDTSSKPLPPVHDDVSPVASPFNDNSYPYNRPANAAHQPSFQSTDSSYHGVESPYSPTGGYNRTDPFADQNAIPLQNSSSTAHLDPKGANGPPGIYMDPEIGEEPKRRDTGKRRRRPQKQGWFKGRITWVVFTLTIVQIGVFVGELIRAGQLTGSPIMIKPQFNFMIGPSPWVLINMGARYTPCMHNVAKITDSTIPLNFLCPNATSYDNPSCSLRDQCGFGGAGIHEQRLGQAVSDRTGEPNQWWRFIVPIFMHAGIIHIAFNMLLQLTLGRDVELQIGPLRFVLVYFASGIFGFVLGGNYAAPLIASTGASGSLFGLIGITLLDILYTWKERRSPVKDLLFICLDIVIMLVLGLLPGLDNFSHIGGFLMGLVLGVCILRSPNLLRQRTGLDDPPYSAVSRDHHHHHSSDSDHPPATATLAFLRQPLAFFTARKPAWWAWWLVRAAMLVAVLVGFIMLLRNFYEFRDECTWCKHLTCLPVSNWCSIGYPQIETLNTTSSAPSRRALESVFGGFGESGMGMVEGLMF